MEKQELDFDPKEAKHLPKMKNHGQRGVKKSVVCNVTPSEEEYENRRNIGRLNFSKSKVKTRNVKSTCGRLSKDCGDQVAELLRGVDEELLFRMGAFYIRKLSGVPCTAEDLIKKYGHLNSGMIRMNIGQRIRYVFERSNKKRLPDYNEFI